MTKRLGVREVESWWRKKPPYVKVAIGLAISGALLLLIAIGGNVAGCVNSITSGKAVVAGGPPRNEKCLIYESDIPEHCAEVTKYTLGRCVVEARDDEK